MITGGCPCLLAGNAIQAGQKGQQWQMCILDHLRWMGFCGMASSVIRRRWTVLTWVAEFLGYSPPEPRNVKCRLLREATPAQLLEWRASLSVSDDAVAVYISHVRQYYRWAVTEGFLDGSPAAGLPAPRRGRRLPRPIAEADLLAALEVAPDRIRPWLVLAGWAGLRACEIAGLRRENVLDANRPPLLLIERDATKGHSERLVPMSAFVLAELRPHLPVHGWVFPRYDGRPGPNSPGHISHLANDHLHECGIAASLHQLRHRFGTAVYQQSRDLRAVQELLGHKSPKTTAGYAAYDAAAAAAAVAAIPVPGDNGRHETDAGGGGRPGRGSGGAGGPGRDGPGRPPGARLPGDRGGPGAVTGERVR